MNEEEGMLDEEEEADVVKNIQLYKSMIARLPDGSAFPRGASSTPG